MVKKIQVYGIMFFFVLAPLAGAQLIEVKLNKEVFHPGDGILVKVEVTNENPDIVSLRIICGISSKDLPPMLQRKEVTLGPYEKQSISFSPMYVFETMPAGEYDVFVEVYEGSEKIGQESTKFMVKDTKKMIDASLKTCVDEGCSKVKSVFIQGTRMYIHLSTSVSGLTVDAKIKTPSGEEEIELDDVAEFLPAEPGIHEVVATLSKEGYVSTQKSMKFDVKKEHSSIVNVTCNSNLICEPDKGENHKNCQQDCPSGSIDSYCDKVRDGVCDPDCLPEEDPDCVVETTFAVTSTTTKTTPSIVEPAAECGNKVCEYLRGETHLTCKPDCPSGGRDNYCDRIEDGICDPDCGGRDDPDCSQSQPLNYLPHIIIFLVLITLSVFTYRKLRGT